MDFTSATVLTCSRSSWPGSIAALRQAIKETVVNSVLDVLTFLWVDYGQGSSGQAPPRVSSAIAISACGVWNP